MNIEGKIRNTLRKNQRDGDGGETDNQNVAEQYRQILDIQHAVHLYIEHI